MAEYDKPAKKAKIEETKKGDDKKKREILQTIGTGHTLKDRELNIEIENILLENKK